ncbi:PD-(D/E)XK nuclease family protein [Saccharopolyspora rosea]|uniref:PD-(D/E)XK nuclease family protein n=1 Tax=Saccharopolyspora rosea TaxID=524884 RepID=UPI0021D87144|nr:PD-(D/E)XK nuclease family protein [Saccharopolyspora rosea]
MQLATFTRTEPVDHPLAEQLRQVVRDADRFAPRSLQMALGPSEIGQPCARRLAYRLMDERRVNTGSDPWAAIVGTAVHAWLAAAFEAVNDRLGRIRYLVEKRVEIRPGLTGSCDLYDADTATVIDHKVVGPTSMKEYRRSGPPPAYRVQAHLYGVGYTRLGVPVREVAVAFYPRSGLLSGLHVWSEPFDPAVAEQALQRHDQVLEAACALDVDRHPEGYRKLPTDPSHACNYCPWFKPGPDTGATCPGHMATN